MPVILGGNTGIYLASLTPAVDPDAQAFITAASITDPTQQAAINTLVVDLKGYSIWSKMKALYPFCGSTASQQKFNLKDPRDLDAAFRLVFSGGWTHSANGALPNGVNSFASTVFNPTTQALSTSSQHLSYYSRTNVSEAAVEIGVIETANNNFLSLYNSGTSGTRSSLASSTRYNQAMSPVDTRGLFISTRVDASNLSVYRNGSLQATQAIASTGNDNYSIFLGAYGANIPALYSTKQCAFASIGDGLSPTEAANFYTAVQTFQVTIGRSIGTQTVSDADAQAFVTNAGIVDQVEANAINNLVIGLKADGLWTKMKAVYPFVGGTATTHKFNLKNPLDTNAAFRLQFIGGWTHSANGALPNGTNGYADSFYIPNTNLADINSNHISIYSRTNIQGGLDMGAYQLSPQTLLTLSLNFSGAGGSNTWNMASYHTHFNLDSRCFMINSRTASNLFKTYKNGTTLLSSTGAAGTTKPNVSVWIGNSNGFAQYSARQYAFASIGDGLTDTDATNLYNIVQTFNTTLARQV